MSSSPKSTSLSLASTPPQPDTHQRPRANDTMSSPSIREDTSSATSRDKDSPRLSLTPADCRTLQRILHDVRSPSPMSTAPYFSDRKDSPLFADDDKSFSNEDARNSPPTAFGSYFGPSTVDPFSVVCREEYEDEDEGLGLSDAGTTEEETDGHRSVDWDGEEKVDNGDEHEPGYEDEDESMEVSDTEGEQDEEKDGDTIEDVMNLPGKTAPPAPAQNFGAVYVHDQPTPDETKEMRIKRAAIERDLVEQARQQEMEVAGAVEETNIQLSFFDGQGEKLDTIHVPGFEELHEEIGMHAVEDEEAVAGALESLEDFDTRPSPFVLSPHHIRRASEDTPLPSTSFIDFPSPCATGVVSTPGGRHIDFAPPSTMPETPFTKTLGYFKQYKGKENSSSKDSPSKRRRNASSPEEIAELAREAAVEEQEAQEEKELEDLEKYRAMDLAPEEPIMESTSAGDLIMCGTPVRTGERWFMASDVGSPSAGTLLPEAWTSSTRQPDMYPSDSETEDWVKVPTTPSPQKPALPIEQDEDHDADVEESDGDEKKQLILYPRHPTFITVIGMLPAAMFWATAAPVVKYGSRAFDGLVERFTGLKL